MSIKDREWIGERVLVIGGGPSLKGLERRIAGWTRRTNFGDRKTIGVNMAFRFNPDVNLVGDDRLIDQLASDQEYMDYEGVKLTMREIRHAQSWTTSTKDGLFWPSDTGIAAVNLADNLWASDIILAGFDLEAPGKLTENWHTAYPEDWRSNAAATYERMLEGWKKALPYIRANIHVLTPKPLSHPLCKKPFHFTPMDPNLL